MPRPTQPHPNFKKTLLAIAASAALAPHGGWALDFAQSPPGTVTPYVAPNVIISVDDSGSMDFRLDMESENGATGETAPLATPTPTDPNKKTWPTTSRRINVLKYALKNVFNDTTLLPDGKIRLAWQVMWNNGGSPGVGPRQRDDSNTLRGLAGATSVDSATMGENSMRVLKDDATVTHRQNFKNFIDKLKPGNGTPTHRMFKQADDYMRRTLSANGPWATKPGDSSTTAEYLGCRRNYHIVMTDGRWNNYVNTYAAGGNIDTPGTVDLPDSTKYGSSTTTGTTNYTKMYRDGTDNTLADWAFKSWSQRLQLPADLTGTILPEPEYDQAPATETIGGVALPKYWNPKYNPATWPHMVTYTIGFSKMAYEWKTDFSDAKYNITRPTEMVPFGYDGDFPNLVKGDKTWPAMSNEDRRSLDLWHAALNGRGRFFAVEQGEDLEKAFRMIIQQINTQNEPDRGSTATSGSNASRNDVGKYVANYMPKEAWRGWVEAETVKKDGTTVPAVGWAGKTTADLLDATGFSVGSRLILSWSSKQIDATTGQEKGGVPFKWASDETNLSTAQKAFLNMKSDGTTDALGQDRLNYVRGDRTKEGTESPANYPSTNPFRQRKSRQGDIVNSEVWYVGAPVSNYAWKGYTAFTRAQKDRLPMIYVGGNDGMLHGFSAENGSEKVAYVPRGVIPAVGRLADPAFNQNHRYYVDGSPMTGDVDMGTGDTTDPTYAPNWHTLLVGSLGAGGKGFFVLDVTNPGNIAGDDAGNFTEGNAQQLVVMDKTRHATEATTSVEDCENTVITPVTKKEACLALADMGHIFTKPVMDEANPQRTTQIVRLNNNRWAAVMGNGYNSKSGRPVLLVQYLDGSKELLRLVATGTTATNAHLDTTDNGLSAPRLVDINGDGRPDVVYAGDLKGNMWKFLLTSNDDTAWGVARWGSSAATTTNHTTSGVPLFTAKGGTEGSPDSRTLAQPITIVPTVRANDRKKEIDIGGGKKETVSVGGLMVAFGTGSNLATYNASNPNDPNTPVNANKQTLYSVLDNTRYKLVGTKKDRVEVCASSTDAPCNKLVKSSADLPAPVTQSSLVQRTIPTASVNTRDGHEFWTITDATVLNWGTSSGWYMDLPQTRERLLKPIEFYDGSNLLTVFSQVPAKGSRLDPAVETCEAGTVDKERQYMTLINIMDGKKPSVQIMDTDGNGKYNLAADQGASRVSVTAGAQTMIKRGEKMRVTGKKPDGTDDSLDNALLPEQSMRPSWRQMQ
ncbi:MULTISPECIES: pilus assembly protein [unclassified Acidovorax]|uniref:pilus assembly protein n=1 Tax=unclassified Acidovorax TaxID=2684926 RepID=UPI001C47F799|nr:MULTISPECIES: PilC/PilY family type IV pilus protein [unclassified Acidovorax]MBV7427683.1 pilus assembly protein PilY [Acidovorax sp. sif0732]MBV7450043.1 pilus assembly protein PilY [Acidovorax sp. sif0715]